MITDDDIYSYILGLYLGDGYINKTPRTYRLRIFMDSKYENLNNYVIKKLSILFPNNKVSSFKKKNENCLVISVYSNKLPLMFPHLGEGKKHERKIELTKWQKNIINYNELMKGLFHSDGSYFYSGKYDRYEFKNYSDDILNIFKLCCDKTGIYYTSQSKVVTINKREEVNKLKENIGVKNHIKQS